VTTGNKPGATTAQNPPVPKNAAPSVARMGQVFCAKNKNDLLYSRGQWRRWNGIFWEAVQDLHQRREFWQVLEQHEAAGEGRASLPKLKGLMDYVQARLYVPAVEMDAQIHLINLQDCTYDLKTGFTLDHERTNLITTALPFAFDARATCPAWDSFVMSTFVHPDNPLKYDHELAYFVREAIGYSLTTSVEYHVTFWCVGDGANGKGVLFHALRSLAGDSAIALNVGLLAREQYQMAMLAGKRLALCTEASKRAMVDNSLIKALIAGDLLNVRQIRSEPFEMLPTVKLWWSMNDLPEIADASEGFWRRVMIIPFNRVFAPNERILDLKDQLDQELPGVFNWVLRGLEKLKARGRFDVPPQVTVQTARRRTEANNVELFVADACTQDPQAKCQSSVIYSVYQGWCKDNGQKAWNSTAFKRLMVRLGFKAKRLNNGMHFMGVALNSIQQQTWGAQP